MSKASDGFNHALDMSAFEDEFEDGAADRVQAEFKLDKTIDEQSLKETVGHVRMLHDYHEQIHQSQELHKTREARLRHLRSAYALGLSLEAAKEPPTDPTLSELRSTIEKLSSVPSTE